MCACNYSLHCCYSNKIGHCPDSHAHALDSVLYDAICKMCKAVGSKRQLECFETHQELLLGCVELLRLAADKWRVTAQEEWLGSDGPGWPTS